jgi:hypothetical protein
MYQVVSVNIASDDYPRRCQAIQQPQQHLTVM